MKLLKLANMAFAIMLSAMFFVACENSEDASPAPKPTTSQNVQEAEGIFGAQANQNKSEDNAQDPDTDCTFGGLIDAKTRRSHYVGVDRFSGNTAADAVAVWTIDGNVVNSIRPTFVRLQDHLSNAAIVEVCYKVTTSECGVINGCITVDFEG